MRKMIRNTNFMSQMGLLYCVIIWGATSIVTKAALDSVHPIAMVGIRFLIAAIILVPWVLKRKKIARHLKESFILAILMAIVFICFTVGLVYTTASNAGFIGGVFIIFIPVFLFLFRGAKPKAIQLVSTGIVIFGLWLLTGGAKDFNRGDVLILVCAAVYAAHLIITDKYIKADADAILLAFHQFWMVALISFFLTTIMNYPLGVQSSGGWVAIIFLAVFPTLSAFYVQMLAQKKLEPFTVGLVFTLEPLFAAAFAWTLGGEEVVYIKALGGFIIFLGMVVGEFSKFNLKRAVKKEVLPI
ncbi:MAG: DMT family transporter [Elusimicrobiales bacterium]|nr:DMT family transporter [Elusimicrobiales bacterium]MCK5584225.1 DMT family transporter [Elusimicrobiales bacterium]